MANYYYSGQGSLYVAQRNADGTPKGFVELGNVPSLELSIEVTKFEHKESQSGSRAVDLTIVQEKNGTFTMNLESITPENLALAFWGANSTVATAALTDIIVVAAVAAANTNYRVPVINPTTGAVYPGITGVVVADDDVPTTTYEFGTTMGSTSTPGDSKNGYIDSANGTLVIFNTAEQTARGAAEVITDGQDLYVSATGYSGYTQVDAFTVSSQERWLRFEGLNTIDNKVVIVDIFKASLDPLTGYGLINEELGSMEINGSMLYDQLQPGTSKFFRQVNVT
jgi:hypothetical protein